MSIASYLQIVTIIHVSKLVSSDSLRSKHVRRLFRLLLLLPHFAFWSRQTKASAKKEGAGRRRGGEARKGNACPQTPQV